MLTNIEIVPGPLAYRDDMAHIADVLSENPSNSDLDYLAQFVTTVARSAQDDILQQAAASLTDARSGKAPTGTIVARMAGLVQERLAQRAVV